MVTGDIIQILTKSLIFSGNTSHSCVDCRSIGQSIQLNVYKFLVCKYVCLILKLQISSMC